MFFVDLTGFLIGLILLLLLVVCVTIFAVAMWKEYHNEFFSVKDLVDDTAAVLKKSWISVMSLFCRNAKSVAKIGTKSAKKDRRTANPQRRETLPATTPARDLSAVYGARPYMTKEEVIRFRQVRRWAARQDLLVFTKVKLSHLMTVKVDPKVNKKPAMLIQSRTADYVLCDETMAVRCVILLDKGEKAAEIRFLRDALLSCGYRVLVTDSFSECALDALIEP